MLNAVIFKWNLLYINTYRLSILSLRKNWIDKIVLLPFRLPRSIYNSHPSIQLNECRLGNRKLVESRFRQMGAVFEPDLRRSLTASPALFPSELNGLFEPILACHSFRVGTLCLFQTLNPFIILIDLLTYRSRRGKRVTPTFCSVKWYKLKCAGTKGQHKNLPSQTNK